VRATHLAFAHVPRIAILRWGDLGLRGWEGAIGDSATIYGVISTARTACFVLALARRIVVRTADNRRAERTIRSLFSLTGAIAAAAAGWNGGIAHAAADFMLPLTSPLGQGRTGRKGAAGRQRQPK
jgi:hypothetical protein